MISANPLVTQQVVKISLLQVLASTTKPLMSRLMKLLVKLLVTQILASIVKFRARLLPQPLINQLLANMESEECSGIKTQASGKPQHHKSLHLKHNLNLVSEKETIPQMYSKVGLFLQPPQNTDFTWRVMTTAS